MSRTKEELKQAACAAIDAHREEIIALGDSIFAEPELGFKEFKTAEKVKKLYDALGYEYQDGVAITGIIAPRKGKESKLRIAVMSELDAVVAPGHRCAAKDTGAAHSCGHNCMNAALAGVAYALKDTGIMEELSGDIVLMSVPAEEYVEIEYRKSLREQEKIHFLGGKQEFIRLGVMDDIDMMVMQHTMPTEGSTEDAVKANCGHASNGFVGRVVRYTGKEAHAAGAPHLGINALSAANIGLMAIQCQRETFRDEDHIRVHPIITKGGDLVNVIPADVRVETYVRGNNMKAILEAAEKVDRAFEAGGHAMGAQCEIARLPGYLPVVENDPLKDLMYENIKALLGEEHVLRDTPASAGSTDAGDISYLMPTIQAYFGGSEGVVHSENYEIVNKEIAYIAAAKAMVMTCIDLLADGAETGLKIKAESQPLMTKEEYLKNWGDLH